MKCRTLPLLAILSCALFAGGCASTEPEADADASNNAISGTIVDAKAEKLKAAYLAADANDFTAADGLIKNEEIFREGAGVQDAHWFTWVVEGRGYLTVDCQIASAAGTESVVIIYQLLDRGTELRVAPGAPLALERTPEPAAGEAGTGTISMKAVLFYVQASANGPALWQTTRGDLPSTAAPPITAQ